MFNIKDYRSVGSVGQRYVISARFDQSIVDIPPMLTSLLYCRRLLYVCPIDGKDRRIGSSSLTLRAEIGFKWKSIKVALILRNNVNRDNTKSESFGPNLESNTRKPTNKTVFIDCAPTKTLSNTLLCHRFLVERIYWLIIWFIKFYKSDQTLILWLIDSFSYLALLAWHSAIWSTQPD